MKKYLRKEHGIMLPERILEFEHIPYKKDVHFTVDGRTCVIDYVFDIPINARRYDRAIDGVKIIDNECDIKSYNDINLLCANTDMTVIFIPVDAFNSLFQ